MKGQKNEITVPGYFDYQGSLRAMYRFVEEYCDFHIMGPLELNLVYSPRKTLVIMGQKTDTEVRFKRSRGQRPMARISQCGVEKKIRKPHSLQKRMRWGWQTVVYKSYL